MSAAAEIFRAREPILHAGRVFEAGEQLPKVPDDPYEDLPGGKLSSTTGHRRVRVPHREQLPDKAADPHQGFPGGKLSPTTGHRRVRVPPRGDGFTRRHLEDLVARGLASRESA